MQLTRLTLALAASASASALVIIPELWDPEEAMSRALPLLDETSRRAPSAGSHVVRVPCAQCQDADRELVLDFGVADDTRLLLNGRELYPRVEAVVMGAGAGAGAGAGVDGETSTRPQSPLGYSLAVSEATGEASTPRLLDLELRVMEVGDRFVDGVPAVNVRLLEALGGKIFIADVVVAPSRVSGCDSLTCRAREGMADVLRALRGLRPFRGCHGRGRHPHPGKHHGENAALRRPQGGNPWSPSQSRRHEWRRVFTHIAAQILLPVLMGISAGVGVALLAMGICSLLFRLAASVRGKRSESRAIGPSPAVTTKDEAFASEKDRLMQTTELSPQYEDEDCKN
ncbi:hypothetical protein E4U53_000142 [Claviceps sorghi]|nr:hypothetical protein E4U53_000142 [Claviceps sorghi]